MRLALRESLSLLNSFRAKSRVRLDVQLLTNLGQDRERIVIVVGVCMSVRCFPLPRDSIHLPLGREHGIHFVTSDVWEGAGLAHSSPASS